jgi:hypothetical protein
MSAMPRKGRKTSASVPVRKTCAGSAASAANSASRRAASRCAATSSSNSRGAKPRASAISAAWARTVEISSALLLPGRAQIRRLVLGQVHQSHVGAMRAARRPAGGGIATAIGGECGAQDILDRQGGLVRQRGSDRAQQVQPRGRKGAGRAAGRQHGVQPQRQGPPCRRGRNGMARHRILQPRQPARIGAPLRQQPVALGHGVVVRRHLPRMGGLQRPGQAVEEAPPARSPFLEQPVHLRRQPDGSDAVRQVGLRADGLAIQAEGAAFGGALGIGSGAEVEAALRRGKTAGGGPGQRRAPHAPPELAHACATQPAPGAEQRNGLEQVGLAHAILAGDGDDGRSERRVQRRPGPEIRQSEASEAQHAVIGTAGRANAPGPPPFPGRSPVRWPGALTPASASAHTAPRASRRPSRWSAPRRRQTGTPRCRRSAP